MLTSILMHKPLSKRAGVLHLYTQHAAAAAAAGIMLLLQALSAKHAIAACMWQHADADIHNQTALQEHQG
jgi:hypothetical protein